MKIYSFKFCRTTGVFSAKCEDENSEPFTSLVCSNGANDYVRSERGRRIHIYVFSPEQRAAFTDFIASERLSRRFKEGIL